MNFSNWKKKRLLFFSIRIFRSSNNILKLTQWSRRNDSQQSFGWRFPTKSTWKRISMDWWAEMKHSSRRQGRPPLMDQDQERWEELHIWEVSVDTHRLPFFISKKVGDKWKSWISMKLVNLVFDSKFCDEFFDNQKLKMQDAWTILKEIIG